MVHGSALAQGHSYSAAAYMGQLMCYEPNMNSTASARFEFTSKPAFCSPTYE